MAAKAIAGELRAWNDSGSTFIVLEVDGYRVDVILHNGKRDGALRPYLESNSHVISEAQAIKTNFPEYLGTNPVGGKLDGVHAGSEARDR